MRETPTQKAPSGGCLEAEAHCAHLTTLSALRSLYPGSRQCPPGLSAHGGPTLACCSESSLRWRQPGPSDHSPSGVLPRPSSLRPARWQPSRALPPPPSPPHPRPKPSVSHLVTGHPHHSPPAHCPLPGVNLHSAARGVIHWTSLSPSRPMLSPGHLLSWRFLQHPSRSSTQPPGCPAALHPPCLPHAFQASAPWRGRPPQGAFCPEAGMAPLGDRIAGGSQ